jgi:hypothetical protein
MDVYLYYQNIIVILSKTKKKKKNQEHSFLQLLDGMGKNKRIVG